MPTMSDLLGPQAPSYPRGYIDGLILSNNGSDSDHDIDVSVGAARDGADTRNMSLTSSITKQIDAAWAVGTAAGGLDTGSVTTDTWYHVWLISNGATVDALFSTSATSPTMPGGYSYKRRIGSVLTDGSSNIIQFVQFNDTFLRKAGAVADVSAASQGTTAVLRTLSVPLGIKTVPLFIEQLFKSAANVVGVYTSPDCDDVAAASPNSMSYQMVAGGWSPTGIINGMLIWTNTSSQIRVRCDTASSTLYIYTYGWVDPRGKDA